ncbi:hypothetical protein BKD09_00835 [Bradyrhizobium japonicum]|uniref:Uncharacterized protein n=1 Tax=Bradyrhizobium japonicum TaxID=375 RepID=A0A1L3F0R2_BRAJP|nr:hypothetical protein [Bradyrhizobium japonicum]APG06860.1 hypothetical protein BKD09_00835 [Bradyrhizobium japonicum]
MTACDWPNLISFLSWLAPILSSFFPWPFLILVALFASPIRNALNTFVVGFASLPRAVTAINIAGMKINLDPAKAKALLSISSEVVSANFDRAVDREVERLKIWDKFEVVIKKALEPMIDQSVIAAKDQSPYRVTIHMPDTLQPEVLYQLIEYFPVASQSDARGRRKSIRFGAIGKAWRLQRSDYSPIVSTDREALIEDWGMTRAEAEQAGRGRQTFLAVIIRDSARIPLAIFYMDAMPPQLLGSRSATEISDTITKECVSSKLIESLVKVRTRMEEQVASPQLN